MSETNDDAAALSRWQRRQARRTSERTRIKKHGASVRRVYIDALRKRLARRKK